MGTKKHLGRNLTQVGGAFYYRDRRGGVERMHPLPANTEREARAQIKALKLQMVAEGRRTVPAVAKLRTVADLVRFYAADGCPLRDGTKRTGKQLGEERRRCATLERLMGTARVDELTLTHCQEYARARLREFTSTERNGSRAVDLELAALSCAFRWAVRNSDLTGITGNPVATGRVKYRPGRAVVHCRDKRPDTSATLHGVARLLFQSNTGQSLGWQILFGAFLGCRCSELLRLRVDAAPQSPGHWDGSRVWLPRSSTHKGTAPFVELPAGDPRCDAIAAHRAWLAREYPLSPWWFPSPRRQGACISAQALSQALRLSGQGLTVHGLRAYYVTARRSQGIPDSQIALEIGHRSGGRLIVETYGEVLPVRLGWVPDDEPPAWEGLALDSRIVRLG